VQHSYSGLEFPGRFLQLAVNSTLLLAACGDSLLLLDPSTLLILA
jgi:hypothetical protein